MSPHESRGACSHAVLYVDKSPSATALSYYEAPSQEQRVAAACLSTRPPPSSKGPPLSTFPGVNLVPQDALDIDPKEPTQTLEDFAVNNYRNRVTSQRRTLYVVDVQVDSEAAEMTSWADPIIPEGLATEATPEAVGVGRPQVDDIADYLKAFYGLEVKTIRNEARFTTWRNTPINAQPTAARHGPGRGYLGLIMGNRNPLPVRFRGSPDGVATGQLNLTDLLNALLAAVPEDAFAIVLVTHHDLYEDEEDDFCAGRAYGGSRVCIASTFRYHPALDEHNKINHVHSWPASHCRAYVDSLWEESEPELKKTNKGKGRRAVDSSCMIRLKGRVQTPLAAAVEASRNTLIPKSKEDWESFWLARVCRTVSHELGHCVGMAHCTYYACTMQSTTNVAEDVRQPPYLCPVCLAKVAYSVVGEAVMKSRGAQKEERRQEAEARWVMDTSRQMQLFCERQKRVGMFEGYRAWVVGRLRELSVEGKDRANVDVEVIEISDDE
ncbi:hypothetical protein ACJ41O_010418 [Fusarium nematophilum]